MSWGPKSSAVGVLSTMLGNVEEAELAVDNRTTRTANPHLVGVRREAGNTYGPASHCRSLTPKQIAEWSREHLDESKRSG
jgi:hypothetical protein